MNDQTQNPDNKVSARRRLIRGVFAAPAALTLYSGSVAARSIQNCVTKQVATPDLTPTAPVASQGTTYVRVQLKKFYGKNGTTVLTNRYSRWISGADVVALQAAGTNAPYLSGSQWQLYDRGITNLTSNCSTNFNPQSAYAGQAPGYVISTTPSEAGSVACSGWPGSVSVTGFGADPDQWVALRVNANGDIVGVVGIGSSTSTSAVYQSCWTSFRLG